MLQIVRIRLYQFGRVIIYEKLKNIFLGLDYFFLTYQAKQGWIANALANLKRFDNVVVIVWLIQFL